MLAPILFIGERADVIHEINILFCVVVVVLVAVAAAAANGFN